MQWGKTLYYTANAGEVHSEEACVGTGVSDLKLGFHAVELRHVPKLIIS